MLLILLSILWYIHLGFLTALVITTCDITIGHNDVEDVMNVQNGKDFLSVMLVWPVIVIIGLIIGIFKLIKLLINFIHWPVQALIRVLDSFVLILKGK
jgi:uncharacterized membrane protein